MMVVRRASCRIEESATAPADNASAPDVAAFKGVSAGAKEIADAEIAVRREWALALSNRDWADLARQRLARLELSPEKFEDARQSGLALYRRPAVKAGHMRDRASAVAVLNLELEQTPRESEGDSLNGWDRFAWWVKDYARREYRNDCQPGRGPLVPLKKALCAVLNADDGQVFCATTYRRAYGKSMHAALATSGQKLHAPCPESPDKVDSTTRKGRRRK
jgi:hypothetical protein